MSQGNLVVENILLYLQVDQAVTHLKQWINKNANDEHILVILSEKASQTAHQLAQALKLRLAKYATKDTTTSSDINVVSKTWRDLPQDVISQDARDLKSKLIFSYKAIYRQVCASYPNEVVILMDELVNERSDFVEATDLPQGIQRNLPDQPSTVNTASEPRRFVYIHSASNNHDGIDIIVEEEPLLQ
jgi:hypothetical protein